MKKILLMMLCCFSISVITYAQEGFKSIEIFKKDNKKNVSRKVQKVPIHEDVIPILKQAGFPKEIEEKIEHRLNQGYKNDGNFRFVEQINGAEYRFDIKTNPLNEKRVKKTKLPERRSQLERLQRKPRMIKRPGNGSKAYVGIKVEPFPYKDSATMSDIRGVRVAEVVEGEAGYNAGVEPEDVIVAINGITTQSPSLFIDAVAKLKPRQEVLFTIYRKGVKMELESVAGLRIGEQMMFENFTDTVPFEFQQFFDSENFNEHIFGQPQLGVRIDNYQEDQGALIHEVTKGSAADKVGLQTGDVIVQFDEKEIKTKEDLVEAVQEKRMGETATVTYKRDGQTKSVVVTFTPHQMYFMPDRFLDEEDNQSREQQ